MSCRRPWTSSRTSRAWDIACCGSIQERSRSRATGRADRRTRRGARRARRGAREVERSQSARRIVLLGEPGIGKTRLANAFLSRAESRARTLSGRCRAYGDGAGLLPLRDILEQLEPLDGVLVDEPDAARILGPLRERALAEPSDAFWAFRRLLEVSASDGPLVVLLEDLHWAAPDLLDLVEYLLGWATGPLLLLCVARPELLESRPEWRDDAIALGPISGDEARTLVELLPERAGLPESVVGAAVEMAEGNPLFLEQLVVFAAEDVLDPLPPTLEVSIASRIDRLPAGERAVLERAAVVGRHFWRSTVEAVSPDDERAAVGSALIALARRRLVHAERAALPGEDGFRFHHALIRDAVYAGVPESRRAELHEAVARVLGERGPERDEASATTWSRRRRSAQRAASLLLRCSGEASRRLGAAGIRAMKRVDGRTAIRPAHAGASTLLTTSSGSSNARSALAYKFSGDPRAEALLDDLARRSAVAGDCESSISRRSSWSGRGSLAVSWRSTRSTICSTRSLEIFDADDDFALGRAWHCRAVVDGVYRFRYRARTRSTGSQTHYERSGFAQGSAIFLRRRASHIADRCRRKRGSHAVTRCSTMRRRRSGRASFSRCSRCSRRWTSSSIRRARISTRRGLRGVSSPKRGALATSWAALAAEVELLAGDPERAEVDPRCRVRGTVYGGRTRMARDEHRDPCRSALSAAAGFRTPWFGAERHSLWLRGSTYVARRRAARACKGASPCRRVRARLRRSRPSVDRPPAGRRGAGRARRDVRSFGRGTCPRGTDR